MSVLYCTRPGKIQYRNSRRISDEYRKVTENGESNGENRLLAGRFEVYILDPSVYQPGTYIRVTRNSNEIPLLNSNNTVGYLTQVNEGNSISFIYTIGFLTAVLEYTA